MLMLKESHAAKDPSIAAAKPGSPAPTHHIRTFFASLLGAAAVCLIFLSILVVWLNRTLTDTATFTATVAPLSSRPEIQNFVAEKVDEQLMKNVSVQDIATTLLPAAQTAGVTEQQLTQLVHPLVRQGVAGIVSSPAFAAQWQNTVRSAHQQFIAQLHGSSDQLTLDLSPAIDGVVADLKQTSLAPVSDYILIDPSAGKLNIQGEGVQTARRGYTMFRQATAIVIVLAVVLLAGCVALSVHHAKTLRRISLIAGVGMLLFAVVLFEVPKFLKIGGDGDPTASAAATAFVQVLLHNLQIACVAIGIFGVVAAIGATLYSVHKHRTA